MTTTYTKRPKTRGRVYEGHKSGSAPLYIEWRKPEKAALKILLTVLGAIPVIGLMFFDFVRIKGSILTGSDDTPLTLLRLFTNKTGTSQLITEAAFNTMQTAEAAAFDVWFDQFNSIFTIIIFLGVFSAVFFILSIVLAGSGARGFLNTVAILFGISVPAVTVYAQLAINKATDMHAVELTLIPFLLVLAGVLSLIYCIRYPVFVPANGRRNFPLTRMIISFVPAKGDGIKEGIRKVIFTTALISFLYFGLSLGIDLYKEWRASKIQNILIDKLGGNVDHNDEVFEKIKKAPVKPLNDYLALYKENNEMIGYIKVGDTKINYPVLQTDNNEFYVDYDFYKNPSKGGAIFADCRNKFDDPPNLSKNTIIYGHNIATGNYFAPLSNYHRTTVDNTLSFYKTNPTIKFDTLYEEHEWKVFACVLFNTQPDYGEVIEYWNELSLDDEDKFNEYILKVMDRSVLFTDVDIDYTDDILTLSTCYWPYDGVDSRAVVFARKVREGESPDVNLDKAKYNRQAIRFDEEERRIGSMYPGYRVWHTCYLKSYKEECIACENEG